MIRNGEGAVEDAHDDKLIREMKERSWESATSLRPHQSTDLVFQQAHEQRTPRCPSLESRLEGRRYCGLKRCHTMVDSIAQSGSLGEMRGRTFLEG